MTWILAYLQASQYPERLQQVITLHARRGVGFLAHFGLLCPQCDDLWFPDLAADVDPWTIAAAQWTAAGHWATVDPRHTDHIVPAG